jgi:signal transduction histidine kinase
MKFFSQLFDAPVEIVIAHGRVVLAAFSLAAIAVDPTEPRDLAAYVVLALILYAAYAVTILATLHWRYIHNPAGWAIHTIDLAAVALLLLLTEGFSSPFLVFFTFALLAASLRWNWQGIAITMALLALIATVIALLNYGVSGQIAHIHQSVIRAAYLIATGTILAYASAHREHEKSRLAKLAQWTATIPAGDQAAAPLYSTLHQAADVLDASRALVTWETDDGQQSAALLQDGECKILDVSAPGSGLTVVPELAAVAFSRTQPDLDRINMVSGSVRAGEHALQGDLVSALKIEDFSSAPFQGATVSGRVFILGNIVPSDDHLPITRIVADHVGAELDRQVFIQRNAQGAAMRERAAIMRDLHDGLLQSLTAARTHLELVSADGARTRAQLQTARDLLRNEQQRLRQFVDAANAADNEAIALGTLRARVEETARLWGCTVSLTIDPRSAKIPRGTANQVSLMLAEAIANAVRHGKASKMQMTVACPNDCVTIEIRDDGRGFPQSATAGACALDTADLPRSLYSRVKELGGRMYALTSMSGSVLKFELPL